MDLLPKTHAEFSEKEYWDKFFATRGNKAFEWYGEYPELSEHLHKYIRHKDYVLVLGCGNSDLSSDLYDVGFSNITNVDISNVVIKQMQAKNKERCPLMKYEQMSVLAMNFPEERFSVALDKGTLDALMSDEKAETLNNAVRYFEEVDRILKFNGRFICVTLLQRHILDALLDYFPGKNWMFRVVRCVKAENKARESGGSYLPVFCVICTKFKKLPSMVLELSISTSDKFIRLDSVEELRIHITETQKAALVCSHLKKNSLSTTSEVSLDLYSPKEQTPRYTIHVVDIPREQKHLEYAAFVVPHGREHEWLFSTPAGRKKLAKMCNYTRLVVIVTHVGQEYEDFQAVQDELADAVLNLAPNDYNRKILFLSVGTELGKRTVRFKGHSKNSGTYIIEDVANETGDKYRRMYFQATQTVIQTEAKLKTIKLKDGKLKEVVDYNDLLCKHHIYMSLPTYISCKKASNPAALVIGLGGGCLCSFLHSFLPKVTITGVDIDEDMLKVAREWFGLNVGNRIKVIIDDGLNFLSKAAIQGTKYDTILFDVDSKDTSVGMSCPPKTFLDDETLKTVAKCLTTHGLLVINVVIRDETLRTPILDKLHAIFPVVVTHKLEEDLNEIITCSLEHLKEGSIQKLFAEAQKAINAFFAKNKVETVDECLETLRIY